MRSITEPARRAGSGTAAATNPAWLRRAARAAVDPLERRVLFAAVAWTGGAGDWFTAAKWSTGVLPNSTDQVAIPAGSTVTLGANEGTADIDTIAAAAGSTIAVAAGSTLRPREGGAIAGTLNVAGNVVVSYGGNTLTVHGATLTAGAYFEADGGTIVNTATVTFQGGSGVLTGAFVNQGTVTATGGILLGGGATFTNATGATVTLTDDGGFLPSTYPGLGLGTFLNNGTLTKSGGTGTLSFPTTPTGTTTEFDGGTFENVGGTVQVNTGTFDVLGSAYLEGGTKFNVAPGATFEFHNTRTDDFYTIDLSGAITGTGGGTVLFDTGSFGTRRVSDNSYDTSASLNFPDGMLTVNGANITLANGQTRDNEVTNLGFINVNHVVAPVASDSLWIVNQGTIRNVGPGDLAFEYSLNDTTGVIDLTTDGGISGGFNNVGLTNKGILRKSAGSGTSAITANFEEDAGPVEIDAGTLSLQNGSVGWIAGPLTIATGAVLDFHTQFHADLQGTLTSTGGGTVTVTSGYLEGSRVQSFTSPDEDGTTQATLAFAPNTLFMRGGYIYNGVQSLVVNTGSVYFEGGGTIDSMENAGMMYVGAGQIGIGRGAVITNDAGGTIDFTAATSLVAGADAYLANAGTVLVEAGAGTLDLATPFPVRPDYGTQGITNTGTIEVETGTLLFPAFSLGSAGTIDAGTYRVDAGASLVTDLADAITVVNGAVALYGNGYFPDVAGVATVGGGFTVGAGATFTTAGPLAVTGTLTVGGKLTVAGALAQTGTLAFAVGGPPGDPAAPSLTVAGATSLAGNLTAIEANGYGPAAGIAFPVATFTSAASGSFATTTGVAPSFTAAVSPTAITLNSTGVASGSPGTPTPTGTSNLGVTTVTGPSTGSPGSTAAISWVVTNSGTGAASGTWHDSVYLTTNGTVDNNSILLGRVDQTGPVAVNGTYTGTLSVALPAVPVAAYKVVVLADSGNGVPDSDRTNNAGASAPFTTTIPSLQLSNLTRGTINVGQDVLYRLTLPVGNDVVLSATFDVVTEADVYVSYHAIPTTTTFDEVAHGAGYTATQLVIPVHQSGDYYVLVHGLGGAGAGPGFTLTPSQVGLSAGSITPAYGGALSASPLPTTVTVTGSGFTAATTVSLVGATATLTPTSVHLVNANTLVATFGFSVGQLGSYAATVTTGASSASLPTPFVVKPDYGGGLAYGVTLPALSRGDLFGTAYLNYTNFSPVDVAAPYFYVSAPNTKFRLPGTTTFSDGSLELLGIGHGGNAAVLAPGEHGSIAIQYSQEEIIGHQAVTGSVSLLDPNDSIDVSVLKGTLRPAGEPADAWDAIYANFLSTVGSTVGGLSAVLLNAATALGYQGTYSPDPSVLFHYALQQAGDFGAITQRYTVGAFGRGQADPFDQSVAADASGNVTVTSSGKTDVFLVQTNGTYVSGDGDPATLTLAGGIYALRQPDGATTLFNADGTLNYFQDGNGNRLTAAYAGGLLASLTATDGDTYTFTHNAAGRVTQVTDPEGRVTTYAYDGSNQLLTSVTTPAGTTTFTYDPGTRLAAEYAITSIAYPDGTHRTYAYDARGRLASTGLDGGAQTTTYAYDAFGDVTATDAAGDASTVTMGPDDQVAAVTDGLGNIARIAYDTVGRPTSSTTPGGLSTTTTYDAAGNPTTQVDPAGNATNYSYDPTLTELLSVTNPDGHATTYAYDAAGNTTGVTDAAGATTSYAYDAHGNLAQVTHPNTTGQTITYTAANLIASRTYTDGTVVSYTYDGHRNLLSVVDSATGTVSYTYDGADRLTSVTYPGGASLTYTYNAAGQLASKVDQTGFTTGYAYDAAGRLSQVTGAAGTVLTAYTYDAAGRLGSTNNLNGSSTASTYDAAGHVLTIVNRSAGGAVASSFAYAYDADGQRTSMATAAGTTTYAYDADGQLTRVVLPGGRTIAYAYDPNGNRTTVSDSAAAAVTYATNSADEYVTVGGTTYGYDADGNLTTSTTGGVTTTYAYNAAGLLASVTTAGGTTTFAYDGLGDRIAATVNGVTTRYLIDPTGNTSVAGAFGATVSHYVYGLGLTGAVDASGAASFYAFDGTGNTADVTNAAGVVSAAYAYLPFGAALSATGTAAAANPFTFGGQFGVQQDGDGLYFMRARSYDPTTGRFTQRDPIGLSGGTNLYRYAGNNPVSLVDPQGTNPFFADAAQGLGFLAENGYLPLTLADNLAAISLAQTTAQTTSALNGATAIGYVSPNLPAVYEPLAAEATLGVETEAAIVTRTVTLGAERTPYGALAVGAYTIGTTIGTGSAKALNALSQATYSHYSDQQNLALQKVLSPDAYRRALANPLARELLQNLANQGITPSEDFIRDAFKLDADLVRARNAPSNTTTDDWDTEYLNANDPNDLFGPAGYGAARFVPPAQAFPYTVTFENKSTASAPAKTVTLTEQLDANLDWTSFQLTGMGFGSHAVAVPAGLATYATSVAVSSTLRVDIAATLNEATGVVTWTFTSIDPATGDSPSDALAGFLPPDDAAGDGAGYVTYTVNPKATLATGATVTAQASIVFDGNPAIATPAFTNTIDAVAPTSTVVALAATQTSTHFAVSWSGSDDAGGSGIASYSVYVSTDGGPYATFIRDTTATSATFAGAPGHTYGFYVIAADGAGNIGVAPAAAQATTTVPAIAKTLAVSNGHPVKFTDAAGSAVTVTLAGPGSGVLNFLAAGNGDPVTFALTGTTGATRVTVRAAGKAGTLKLTDVSTTGSLAAFTAATADLIGSFAVTGTLGLLSLDNATDGGATVTIGGAGVATALRFGVLHDVSLTTAAPIKSLTVTSWTDGPDAAHAITAPALGTLTVAGDFDPTITLTGSALALRSANVRGSVTGGAWSAAAGSIGAVTVRGNDAASLTAAALGSLKVGGNLSGSTVTLTGAGADLAKLSVTGTMTGSTIAAAGGIGAVTVGGMTGSTLFAGVPTSTTGLPTTAADLGTAGSIRSFTTTGRSPFAASDVAAHTVGSVTLRTVTTDDVGTLFGVAAHALGTFALDQPKAKPVRYTAKQLTSTITTLGGDLRVEVL